MNSNLTQHFRREERPFIDQMSELIEKASSHYSPQVTNFLNPREQYILETLVKREEDLFLAFFGGYGESERKRAIVYPDYFEVNEEDFRLVPVAVHYPTKFAELTHGKILGTILSTGIKRDYIGDIITNGEDWQVFLTQENARFILSNVQKIGKVSVSLEEIEEISILDPKNDWMSEETTITSLRLDNLVSVVYNISRNRSKLLIEAGKVQVNFTIIERPDYLIELQDFVTVRKFGRIQVSEIAGITKKGKLKITYQCIRK